MQGPVEPRLFPVRATGVTELSAAPREQLVGLIRVVVANMEEGHAKVKRAEVRAKRDATPFAWIGGTEAGGVFSSVFTVRRRLVEFERWRTVNRKQLAKDPQAPTGSLSLWCCGRRTGTTTGRIGCGSHCWRRRTQRGRWWPRTGAADARGASRGMSGGGGGRSQAPADFQGAGGGGLMSLKSTRW